MATIIEPVLKTWYDNLKEGKILGLKCKDCGTVEFPPVPICNHCGCMETEWVEMSGEMEVTSLGYSPMGVAPYHQDPVVFGFGELKEGMIYCATLLGATKEDFPKLYEKLPFKATLEVTQMNEDVYFPNLRIKE